MFIVYALYNPKIGKVYIGQTSDLDQRLSRHNDKTKRRGWASSQRGEWVLIYTESAATRSAALAREKQLKSAQGREFVKKYIPG